MTIPIFFSFLFLVPKNGNGFRKQQESFAPCVTGLQLHTIPISRIPIPRQSSYSGYERVRL